MFLSFVLITSGEIPQLGCRLAVAAKKLTTNRLRLLLGKEKTASGHFLYLAHACLVPVNYATTKVLRNCKRKKRRHDTRVYATTATSCCFCQSFCPPYSATRWTNKTAITTAPSLSISRSSWLAWPMFFCVGISCSAKLHQGKPPGIYALFHALAQVYCYYSSYLYYFCSWHYCYNWYYCLNEKVARLSEHFFCIAMYRIDLLWTPQRFILSSTVTLTWQIMQIRSIAAATGLREDIRHRSISSNQGATWHISSTRRHLCSRVTPCAAAWRTVTPQVSTGGTLTAILCLLIGFGTIQVMSIAADDEGPCKGIELNIWECAKV